MEGIEAEGENEEPQSEGSPPRLGQAWEIDFGPSDSSSKPKKLPRFLSKVKPQRTGKESVKLKATPSPGSTTRTTEAVMPEKREGKSLSPGPIYHKSTPTQAPAKSRTALSAPAKSSKLAMTGIRSSFSSAISTAQSRTSAKKSSAKVTPSSSRVSSAATSRTQRNANSLLSATSGSRPTSAPSTASKIDFRGSNVSLDSSKSLSSKQKTAPKSSKVSEKRGRKLSLLWKKRDSKEHMKTDSESGIESEEGKSGGLGVDKTHQRSFSLRTSRGGGSRDGVRRSTVSKKSNKFQSNEKVSDKMDDGWWGKSDERGFESFSQGSWGRKQHEQFERIRSQQFSPRMQTTPDIVSPNSKASDRKLKEVQRWVQEVTLQTQQEVLGKRRLPVVSLFVGGLEGECRLAVTPDDMACRKVFDLRRW